MCVPAIHAGGKGTRELIFSVTGSETLALQSAFRWEARVGPVALIDAYEGGHGVTAVQPPGSEAADKTVRPEIGQASLQRYLAATSQCPPGVDLGLVELL